MTRLKIREVIEELESAGEGDTVASRALCRDALTLLREVCGIGTISSITTHAKMVLVFEEIDSERKAVKS